MTEMNHGTPGDVPPQPMVERDAGFEVPRYHIPEVVALDFDRTLADNGACMERLYTAAEGLPGFNLEQMKAEQKRVEQKGTFDPLQHIRELLLTAGDNITADGSLYDQFCRRFVGMSGPKILYDDAERFLAVLQQADVPHIILTYGNNFEWQFLKLDAARYPVSRKIMQDSRKGAQVRKYQRGDGKFHFYVSYAGVAEYIADAMVLIDDKSPAFDDFPEAYPGFKIIRGEELPSQRGPIPSNVTPIGSFDELTVIGGRLRLRKPDDPPADNNFARRWTTHGEQELRYVPKNAVYAPTVLHVLPER